MESFWESISVTQISGNTEPILCKCPPSMVRMSNGCQGLRQILTKYLQAAHVLFLKCMFQVIPNNLKSVLQFVTTQWHRVSVVPTLGPTRTYWATGTFRGNRDLPEATGATGTYWGLPDSSGPTGAYQDLPGHTGAYQNLSGSTRIYWDLPGPTRTLPGLTKGLAWSSTSGLKTLLVPSFQKVPSWFSVEASTVLWLCFVRCDLPFGAFPFHSSSSSHLDSNHFSNTAPAQCGWSRHLFCDATPATVIFT